MQARWAICSVSVFIYFLSIPVRPVISKIYHTDLCQIYVVGRIMAVDDQPEISFLIPLGTLPWQPNFVGFSARVWMQVDI